MVDVVYIADFQNIRRRMHLISAQKLDALLKHPKFDCVDVRASFFAHTQSRLGKIVAGRQLDVLLHDAAFSRHFALVSGLEHQYPFKKMTLVEDYHPYADGHSIASRCKFFDNYIAIPFEATKHLDNCAWIGHYISPEFNDYGLEKDIDVLIYGQIDITPNYPFRKRLAELFLKNQDKFVVKQVPFPGHFVGTDTNTGELAVGEKLSRLINRSHLVIGGLSVRNYMVKKYLEVPASMSTVLGNVNEECQMIYPNLEGILPVSPDETDEQILQKVRQFLDDDTKPSKEAFRIARERNPTNYAKRLYEIICEAV